MRFTWLAPAALTAATLLHAVPGAAAGVFKWVDDNGRVHYGDRPPAGGADAASSVQIEDAPAVDRAAAQRSMRREKLLDTLSEERAQRTAKAEKLRLERAEQDRRCARARQQLALYERANLLYHKGKDGEHTYLSDDERDAAVGNLRDGIARGCKLR